MAALKKNILVISDLHLGEDLKPQGPNVEYLRHLVCLERELVTFLAHYTANRIEDRPWRLVINGDMVDFMSIILMPEAGSGHDEDQLRYGLGHDEKHSAAKLARVFDRHHGVFQALAAFVAAGNELVVVVGNHDIEFFFPAVQSCFLDRLTALVPVEQQTPELRAAIRFCPWFYYEEEVVYVEHGHQYDEFCSFDYQLHPVEPRRGVTLSIAHASVRYFSNLVPTLNPHASGEVWGFLDWARWAWAHGARGIARLVQLYGLLVWKLLAIWSTLTDRQPDRERLALHRRALQEMSTQHRIAVEKLHAIDALRCVPVLKRLSRVLSALFLDRLLLGVVLTAGLVVAVAVPVGWHKAPAAAAVLAAGAVINWLLTRGRGLASTVALRRTPQAILKILRAPFIVFGHSHTAERVPLAGGGTYFNTGTWAEEVIRFPHLVISDGVDQPKAEMLLWTEGRCDPFTEKKTSA